MEAEDRQTDAHGGRWVETDQRMLHSGLDVGGRGCGY